MAVMSKHMPTEAHLTDPYVLQLLGALSAQQDRIEELEELTKNDGIEIGSYRKRTGLRGHVRGLRGHVRKMEHRIEVLEEVLALEGIRVDVDD